MRDPGRRMSLDTLLAHPDGRFRPNDALRLCLGASPGLLDRPLIPLLNALAAAGARPWMSCAGHTDRYGNPYIVLSGLDAPILARARRAARLLLGGRVVPTIWFAPGRARVEPRFETRIEWDQSGQTEVDIAALDLQTLHAAEILGAESPTQSVVVVDLTPEREALELAATLASWIDRDRLGRLGCWVRTGAPLPFAALKVSLGSEPAITTLSAVGYAFVEGRLGIAWRGDWLGTDVSQASAALRATLAEDAP